MIDNETSFREKDVTIYAFCIISFGNLSPPKKNCIIWKILHYQIFNKMIFFFFLCGKSGNFIINLLQGKISSLNISSVLTTLHQSSDFLHTTLAYQVKNQNPF